MSVSTSQLWRNIYRIHLSITPRDNFRVSSRAKDDSSWTVRGNWSAWRNPVKHGENMQAPHGMTQICNTEKYWNWSTTLMTRFSTMKAAAALFEYCHVLHFQAQGWNCLWFSSLIILSKLKLCHYSKWVCDLLSVYHAGITECLAANVLSCWHTQTRKLLF